MDASNNVTINDDTNTTIDENTTENTTNNDTSMQSRISKMFGTSSSLFRFLPIVTVLMVVFGCAIKSRVPAMFAYLIGCIAAIASIILLRWTISNTDFGKRVNVLPEGVLEDEYAEQMNGICSSILNSFNPERYEVDADVVLLVFTFMYFIVNMVDADSFNAALFFILLFMCVANMGYRMLMGCSSLVFVIISAVWGVALGVGWYYIVKLTGNDKLMLFTEDDSDSQTCSVPSKQRFKCSVYKNGEIVHTQNIS